VTRGDSSKRVRDLALGTYCDNNNNVRIQEGDEWEGGLSLTNQGLFKPLVMFFGLTNSMEIFQMIMNNIF